MLPKTLHAWQAAVQAVLQQTPSTHEPLAHCAADVHVDPFGPRQIPPWQIPL
jgi:hypothetical protein